MKKHDLKRLIDLICGRKRHIHIIVCEREWGWRVCFIKGSQSLFNCTTEQLTTDVDRKAANVYPQLALRLGAIAAACRQYDTLTPRSGGEQTAIKVMDWCGTGFTTEIKPMAD